MMLAEPLPLLSSYSSQPHDNSAWVELQNTAHNEMMEVQNVPHSHEWSTGTLQNTPYNNNMEVQNTPHGLPVEWSTLQKTAYTKPMELQNTPHTLPVKWNTLPKTAYSKTMEVKNTPHGVPVAWSTLQKTAYTKTMGMHNTPHPKTMDWKDFERIPFRKQMTVDPLSPALCPKPAYTCQVTHKSIEYQDLPLTPRCSYLVIFHIPKLYRTKIIQVRIPSPQKSRVYLVEEQEEPAFQYVPESNVSGGLVSSGSAGGEVAPLHESMLLLGEGLEAGSLVAQFEQLYRRKPGLTVAEARRQDNEKKNRYRDISPYDNTRVVLTQAPSGDYINASYVNMEVQGSGIVNRYIACQGPLAGTCADFWHMVWEQQSTLIVMLTTVVEQGRVKCHRYWPRHYETVDFGTLQVTCLKEDETPGFAYREFTLINTETQEERHISHMQYLAWPDHGVPDDSTEFLNFITQVRKARTGMVEPTIVHCSAGIGRTGVLILMETAQCLIEANEPVYPLDVVRAMRDQRAMMIQTASQFRFVCEAIQRVYSEGLVKPLAEYQQR